MLPALWGGWAGAARSHKLQWRALLLAALQMALLQVTSFQKKGLLLKITLKPLNGMTPHQPLPAQKLLISDFGGLETRCAPS